MAKAKTKTKAVKVLRGGLDASPIQRRQRDRRASHHQRAIDSAPSGYWADEIEAIRTPWPVPGTPGMLLSEAKVLTPPKDCADLLSNSRGVNGTRRWTPPHNVTMEDGLDCLSIKRAAAATAGWPSACRYDHGRPGEESTTHGYVHIADPWDEGPTLRCVKLGEWPLRQLTAGRRINRVGVLGIVVPGWAELSYEVPDQPIVESWIPAPV